jgi:hypothetical protein
MIPYVDIIINMMIRNLMIFGSQPATCFPKEDPDFWGYTVSHLLKQKVKKLSIFNFNTSGYISKDNSSISPPTSSNTSSISLS